MQSPKTFRANTVLPAPMKVIFGIENNSFSVLRARLPGTAPFYRFPGKFSRAVCFLNLSICCKKLALSVRKPEVPWKFQVEKGALLC